MEEFLFTSLINTYGRSTNECKNQIGQIPIIHLHGSLGALPWQGERSRSFDSNLNEQTLGVAREGIKIIHEATTDGRDKDFERGHELLLKAKRIILLGFGYNALNMERLGIRDVSIVALGTGLGLTDEEIGDFRASSNDKISIYKGFDALAMLRSISWR